MQQHPMREKARELWESSLGDVPLSGIARAIGVPTSTVRDWKRKDQWSSHEASPKIRSAQSGPIYLTYRGLMSEAELSVLPSFWNDGPREILRRQYAMHLMTERQVMRYISDIERAGDPGTPGARPNPRDAAPEPDRLLLFLNLLCRIRVEMRNIADGLRRLDDSQRKTHADSGQALIDAMVDAYGGEGD